jgi:Family of unknown function (DUF5662)
VRNHLKYGLYLIKHKWWVFYAGLRLQVPLWSLIIHDWSKFSRAEWSPYVQQFFGDSPLEGTKDRTRFQWAWLHHIHKNPHHWQHHLLRRSDGTTEIFEMPERAVREMVADWAGVGKNQHGSWEVGMWYWQNRDTLELHPRTQDLVETLVDGFELQYVERKKFSERMKHRGSPSG